MDSNVKFSIVVPVYNVENYLNKCIDSILNQTYKNFEVILVDDGSTDKSSNICDKYAKNNSKIKAFHKKNGGLSDARNFGVENTTGDYLLFIDSDDYIEPLLLEKLNNCILKGNVDLIRFGLNIIDQDYKFKFSSIEYECINNNPLDLLDKLISTKFLEPACFYCYNLNFFKENKFKYEIGKLHEDFGLTPLIICKAKSMSWINYNAYNYVQRNGSIVNSKNKDIDKKKAYDMLFHYDNFIINCNHKKIDKIMLDYIIESLFNKAKYLENNEYNEYIKQLKNRRVAHKIYAYNYKKLIKKIISIISINLYIKIFCK